MGSLRGPKRSRFGIVGSETVAWDGYRVRWPSFRKGSGWIGFYRVAEVATSGLVDPL